MGKEKSLTKDAHKFENNRKLIGTVRFYYTHVLAKI